MRPNLSKCVQMCRDVSKCVQMSPQFAEMCANVSKCIQIYPNVSKCVQMCPHVFKCAEMCPNVSKCAHMDLILPPWLQGRTWPSGMRGAIKSAGRPLGRSSGVPDPTAKSSKPSLYPSQRPRAFRKMRIANSPRWFLKASFFRSTFVFICLSIFRAIWVPKWNQN